MMWNTRYGVMGDFRYARRPDDGRNDDGWLGWNRWYGNGAGKVTSDHEAASAANRWLATVSPGEQVASDAGARPWAGSRALLSSTRPSTARPHGMLSVNATTGTVWYHGWHSTFLSERSSDRSSRPRAPRTRKPRASRASKLSGRP